MATGSGRIVVVEDEPEVLGLLCEVLEEDGFGVLGLPRPDLVIVDAVPDPKLFVIDLMLPGMDGIELAYRLRKDGFPHTPMVAISASERMLNRAFQSGLFQDTVAKPFDVCTVLDCVARHVG